jgi:hypothetical protein
MEEESKKIILKSLAGDFNSIDDCPSPFKQLVKKSKRGICDKCKKEIAVDDCYKVLEKIREHYDCENPKESPYSLKEMREFKDTHIMMSSGRD